MVVGLGGALAPLIVRLRQQLAAERAPGSTMAVGEEAEVADAVEAGRQNVQEEPADDLGGIERHDLGSAFLPAILPSEADGVVGDGDQAAIGDGDAGGVAPEIGRHLLRAAEGGLGVDPRVDPPQRRATRGGSIRLGQRGKFAEDAQGAVGEGGGEAVETEPPEQPAEPLDRQEDPGLQAIQRVRSG